MLIDLWLTPKHNILNFDLPPTDFNRSHKVCVTHFFIHWGKPVSNSALTLSSTLIDKSSFNTKQQLIFVYQKGKSQYLNYTPTHKKYYKIQCFDLASSHFEIRNIDNRIRELENIEKIYIQLEIIE